RGCGRDDGQGAVGSEFAHSTLKAKSAYIVHDKTTYGQGVAEFFKADAEKKGVKILGFEGTEEKSNFDPILTPVKAKGPGLIYFGGIYDQAAPFFKQASEKGIKARFRSEEHTSELQSRRDLVCRLLLEKKKLKPQNYTHVCRI